MKESNKKDFWILLNTCAESCNREKLSKTEILEWWYNLNLFEFADIQSSINSYLEVYETMPTSNDIIKRIPSKTSENKSIDSLLDKSTEPDKLHYLKWAINMDKNPNNYRSDDVAEARKILRSRGIALS